ncbi:hypothetical protein MNBD_NITROSPINAE02-210 [hydrothermal vent metagenome]|uniref:Uncharacterized protein n=1 Tax=hydrothermal vent metagenome TaxID=652676 RepID=A0A3B1C3N9_9ZZZZ
MSNLAGTLVLLGVLMFIVYRILQTLNNQTQYSGGGNGQGGKVYHMPERRRAGPPVTVSLTSIPEEENPFTSQEGKEAHETLTKRGELDFAGYFSVKEMPGYFLAAYTHPRQSLIGIIYRDPKDNIWVNLITEYADGRVITSSSAEDAPKTKRPKGMPLFNYAGLATAQLLRRHKLETRASEKAPAKKIEEFPEFFSSNYLKLRQNLDALAKQEKEKTSPKAVTTLPPPLKDRSTSPEPAPPADFTPTPADFKNWLDMIYSRIQIPKEGRAEFQRGLVWVIQNAEMPTISQIFADYADVRLDEVEKGRWVIRLNGGAEDIIEPGELTGSALFDKINSSLPSDNRFFKIPVDIQGVSFYSRQSV